MLVLFHLQNEEANKVSMKSIFDIIVFTKKENS